MRTPAMAAFRAAALVTALVTASVAPADALPKFNTPNDFDLDHNVCTRPPKAGVSCPPLCVRNPQTDCPAPYNKCPDGQSLCINGICAESCPSYLENPCTCDADTAALLWEFRPCVLVSVTVPFFDPGNATEATNQLCSMEYGNITATFDSVELATANLTAGFVTCPVEEAKYTYGEPAFLVSYGIFSALLLLVGLWTLFKSTVERSVRLRASRTAYGLDGDKTLTFPTPDAAERENECALDEKTADDSSTILDLTDAPIAEDNIIIRGYNNSRFGTFVLTTVVLFAVLLQVVLLLLVLDYYGILLSKPDGSRHEMGLFGLGLTVPHSINFVAVWHVTLFWLLALLFAGPRIRNFFRLQVLPTEGRFVQVCKKKDPVILLNDGGKLLTLLSKAEALVASLTGSYCNYSTVPIQFTNQKRRFVEFQCTRYVYDENSERFDPYQFDLGSTQAEVLAQKDGLDTAEHQIRYELLGPNFISVEVGSFWRAMAQEFSSPFYLYQLMCLWVWYYFAYFNMGLVQTCVILISAVIKVILRLRSEQRVKEMAEFSTEVNVFRNGLWSMASSTSLVPGDIFEVEDKALMPCDAAVLSGTVVCDESNLTGEALPVRKFPLKNEEVAYEKSTSGKLHTLFDGSKVLQALPAEGVEKVTALVLGTGTASDKGRLIHHILFPAPVSFIFNEHLKVVIAILLVWGCIAMGLSIWLMGLSEGSAITAWFYGLFVISQVLSPLIPAALVVGQSVAATRLKTKGIFCIDLPRIIIAGKCRIFCFDKTGTLTRNGLEWEAFRPVEIAAGATPAFGQPLEKFGDVSDTVKMGLSTCHAVGKVNGELIGNPVDIEMFRGTGCSIEAATGAGVLDVVTPSTPAGPEQAPPPPYKVIKRFEFVHVRMSMSVAVLDTANGHVHIFVKGSFEKVRGYADPGSVPQDYDRVASQHAKEGCYVLALAHRELGAIDPAVVKSWTREEFETKVRLCGLILFRNKLKHDTTEAIADLTAGDCRPVMITGDNTLTGVHIARACGMVTPSTRIVLGDATPGSEVLWRDFETWEPVFGDVRNLIAESQGRVELAISGNAFRELLRTGIIRDILLDTRIFARMAPDDKVTCVKLHMERGVTAMCGDGGNDCGALRAAHVGIALSEAEASIVSPFSTSNRSIFSCVELLKQGRAALATSFAGYKYLMMYGATMAWLELVQYYFSVIASQWLWIMYDGFVTVGLSFALTLAKPAPKLARLRPTARLLGPQTLASAIGPIFINLAFFVGAVTMLFRESFFKCREFDAASINTAYWWLLGDNFEAEVIGLVALFQFINSSIPFSFGYRFRAAFYRNWVHLAMYTGMMGFASFLVLAGPNRLSCVFRVNCGSAKYLEANGYGGGWDEAVNGLYNNPWEHNIMPVNFRIKLFVYILANCAANILYERFVVLGRFFGCFSPK